MSTPEPGAEPFQLPDLGEGLTEAEIVTWHVQADDHVVADQPVVSVETDKAIVEIPAPHAGRIGQLQARVGESIRVGAVLFTFAPDNAARTGPATSVVGELPETPATTGFDRPVKVAERSRAGLKASPRARQRARDLGIALADVTASGPGDVIQENDVQGFSPDVLRLTGVGRAMAMRMADANARVVRATVTGEANISQWSAGSRPILRLIRAIGAACTAHPLLNAAFDDDAFTLTLQPRVNLGIAMEATDGLFVPVIEDITGKQPQDLQSTLEKLKSEVAARTINAGSLRGQTITLSNFGAVGGLYADMVVVPPQVAIVGAGRAFDRLVLADNTPTQQRYLPLSITFDHRVATGMVACGFLLALIDDLELPE